jgi:CheY-like chemotaxis protein
VNTTQQKRISASSKRLGTSHGAVTRITESPPKNIHYSRQVIVMNVTKMLDVLVIDNNQHVLLRLRRELEDFGYSPVTTWSGVDALRLLQSTNFGSLLVSDYLSDMYVGDFLERVLRLPAVPRIWIMQDKPASEVRLYGAGCFQVVDKKKAVRALHTLYVN